MIYFAVRKEFREEMELMKSFSRISISNYDGDGRISSDFSITETYSSADIVLERITSPTGTVIYGVTDRTKTMLFSGEDLAEQVIKQLMDLCVQSMSD